MVKGRVKKGSRRAAKEGEKALVKKVILILILSLVNFAFMCLTKPLKT